LKFILVALPPNLPARWHKIYNARLTAIGALATQDLRSAYISRHPSWGRLKTWLSKFNGYKCWYCEAKGTRAPFDVDHFRPKLGVTIDGVSLANHTGYYWLSYECWNFRLSCQRCNRPEKSASKILHGKFNEFPIQTEAHRCQFPANSLNAESPRLLDPCIQNDCILLAHGLDGEVKPAAQAGTWEYQRADYTIKRLGFNEWNTPESKRINWQTLATLIKAVGNTPNKDTIEVITSYLNDDHEYSSFFRSAIGTHCDKAWVKALL
jgi:hypothetical protein